jgi:hypothetical protein
LQGSSQLALGLHRFGEMRLGAIVLMVTASLGAALAAVGACGGSSYDAACVAAGGQCILNESYCADPGGVEAACHPTEGPGVFCCLHVTGSCGQPAVTTYSEECDAGDPTSTSCEGTPPVSEIVTGIPSGVLLPPDDPDASFGQGCKISYPLCTYSGAWSCTCSGQPSPWGLGWTCNGSDNP